eukprot:gnl/TRDRNA2_/TRDRNA2_168250_c0_seq4.p1 gnl/TRDRNA2_/TRDRNA2_168250_c0~~gnl/TRDRNA2_/TRDRNA2_168250_c0_seq4.p1  ORF type:complete len:444 (+),score=92.75 gnl/TRDRNA2_/TRDRNA2_168250_c0_seq4:69-1400(+)
MHSSMVDMAFPCELVNFDEHDHVHKCARFESGTVRVDRTSTAAALADAERIEREAIALAETGCMQRAAELFASAARLMPGEARFHEARAQCLLELDEFEGACEAAKMATKLRPDWCVANMTLGRALRNAGHLQEAVESFAHAKACLAAETDTDEDLEADLRAETAEAEALLEKHWERHHDVTVLLPPVPERVLRIRQCHECHYCFLGNEHGPGTSVRAAGVVLASRISSQPPPSSNFSSWQGTRVLELGSGTGVGGLAAAAAGAKVLLTDGEQLVSVMQRNIDLNAQLVATAGGDVECVGYDWLFSPPRCVLERTWDIVVCSDLVYAFASVQPFANVLALVLRTSKATAALYAHNPRSPELDAEMHAALAARGLKAKTFESARCSRPLRPTGNIGLPALERIVLIEISAERILPEDSDRSSSEGSRNAIDPGQGKVMAEVHCT